MSVTRLAEIKCFSGSEAAAQARGFATPASVTSQSIGRSNCYGRVSGTRPTSKPTPTATVRSTASVRSK